MAVSNAGPRPDPEVVDSVNVLAIEQLAAASGMSVGNIRGISLSNAVAVLEEIEKHCDAVSRAFVKLFLREVRKPFQQADMPPELWPEVEEAIERLRPIASEALLSIFQQRLSTQIEGAIGEITRRLSPRRRTA